MTILATHVAVVLGAWRLRIRIDIDEPREADVADDRDSAPRVRAPQPAAGAGFPGYAPWGRG